MEIKLIECPVCGAENIPVHDKTYTVQKEEHIGLVAVCESHKEPKLWDAMDCGQCGCQIRLARRLRPYQPEEGCECVG